MIVVVWLGAAVGSSPGFCEGLHVRRVMIVTTIILILAVGGAALGQSGDYRGRRKPSCGAAARDADGNRQVQGRGGRADDSADRAESRQRRLSADAGDRSSKG